jgi:ribosomal protein L40E
MHTKHTIANRGTSEYIFKKRKERLHTLHNNFASVAGISFMTVCISFIAHLIGSEKLFEFNISGVVAIVSTGSFVVMSVLTLQYESKEKLAQLDWLESLEKVEKRAFVKHRSALRLLTKDERKDIKHMPNPNMIKAILKNDTAHEITFETNSGIAHTHLVSEKLYNSLAINHVGRILYRVDCDGNYYFCNFINEGDKTDSEIFDSEINENPKKEISETPQTKQQSSTLVVCKNCGASNDILRTLCRSCNEKI